MPRGDIFITERRTGSKTMSTETSEVFLTATFPKNSIEVSIGLASFVVKVRVLGLESVGRGRTDFKTRHHHIGRFGAKV